VKKFAFALAFGVCGVLWPSMASYAAAPQEITVPASTTVLTQHLACNSHQVVCTIKTTITMAAYKKFVSPAGTAAAGPCSINQYRTYIIAQAAYGSLGNELAWAQVHGTTGYNYCSVWAAGSYSQYWSCCFWSLSSNPSGQYYKSQYNWIDTWNHSYFDLNFCSPVGCVLGEQIELWMYFDVNINGVMAADNHGVTITYLL
jgi:hypothetical protein